MKNSEGNSEFEVDVTSELPSCMDEEKLPVVAAIDFGTSHSGFAFAFRSECSESRCGQIYKSKWTSRTRGSGANGKTPTTALFDQDMQLHAFGFEAEEKYSELTENKNHEGWHYFRHFKMKLHGKMKLKREFEIEDEGGQSFPALKVFGESIKYLKDKLIKMLEISNPMNELKKQENTDYSSIIKWVLTIPAIWNEPAKQFMREAAIKGGIPSEHLHFALEPEAAAVFCKNLPHGSFKDSNDEDIREAFAPGGKYMILDLGGGTVDIVVHEISQDGTLIEIVKASGGAWGGTRLNEEFFSYIAKTFGEDHVKEYIMSHFYDWLQLEDEIEERKKNLTFESDMEKGVYIRVPVKLITESNLKVEVQSYNKLKLLNRTMKDFYDASVDQIKLQVRKILSGISDLKLILAVGGFSNSEYLLGVMKKEFTDKRILRPLLADTAVLEGAVMFGFFPLCVSSRICRFTYGIRVCKLFIEGEHLPSNKQIVDGRTCCVNIFESVVQEGEKIKAFEKREIETLRSTHKADGRKYIDITIPVYASTNKEPKYTTDGSCTHIGEIRIHPPKTGWPENVNYKVMCYFGGTELKVKVKNDVNNSEVSATYDLLLLEY